jgi:hypothetical protein
LNFAFVHPLGPQSTIRNPQTCGLPFPETALYVNRPCSSLLLVKLPFNLQQQWPVRVSIDCPNLLSPALLTPVIASSLPQLHKQIQSPVSGITDLEFHLEREHARHLQSSADSLQYNGPVNPDVMVSRFLLLLAPAVVRDAL